MNSPEWNKDEIDELFRTFEDDLGTDEDRCAPVPAPLRPIPDAGQSAIAFPEPDEESA